MRRLLLCGALFGLPAQAAAQDVILIEALAPILQAEDQRNLDLTVFARALEYPDAMVRRTAVIAVGRIGSRDGVILLAPRLRDSDATVVTEAIFALGLLRDPRGVTAILDRLRADDSLSADAVREAATALARIGGTDAARALGDVISGSGDIPRARRDLMITHALIDGWRLGSIAPASAMMRYVTHAEPDLRWRSVYSLGRLRAPVGGEAVLRALRDDTPLVREAAARSLTAAFADTTGVSRAAVLSELRRALEDESIGVRTNALVSLATFRDSTLTSDLLRLIVDADRNVRVAATSVLVSGRGSAAIKALDALVSDPGQPWVVQRTALGGLARLDTAAFSARSTRWLESSNPFDRLAGLEGWGAISGTGAAVFAAHLRHADARVRAAALQAWRQASPDDTALRSASTAALSDTDATVRVAALAALTRQPTDEALAIVATAWAGGDADVREALLGTLTRWSRADSTLMGRLTAHPALLERPASRALRAQAAQGWPALAQRWGPVGPVETGRTIADYRELVRVFVLARENPRITIDTEGRGAIEIELLAREAPLTVANMLRLVDRRYFDNGRWHRVVANFVIQDGDPTGTGSGGPGWSIRDEINRRRYLQPMLGMALSGPDTGGSQWFINLSPQPHLDGGYTIFGRVVGSYSGVRRVLQGDPIRTIRR